MFLTKKEQEKLMIFSAGQLAKSRKERGLKLNFAESTAFICSYILEGARENKSVSQLMVEASQLLNENDVLEGVSSLMHLVQIEATFEDGTKLVSVHNPISGKNSFECGELVVSEGEIVLNASCKKVSLMVENMGDRPVQIGSHFHFFEANKELRFDRELGYGMRLDIPSGTSVRFEPGSSKEVNLIPFGGKRFVSGFNGLVEGFLDDGATKKEAFANLKIFLDGASYG